jgi:hypothetical protein
MERQSTGGLSQAREGHLANISFSCQTNVAAIAIPAGKHGDKKQPQGKNDSTSQPGSQQPVARPSKNALNVLSARSVKTMKHKLKNTKNVHKNEIVHGKIPP